MNKQTSLKQIDFKSTKSITNRSVGFTSKKIKLDFTVVEKVYQIKNSVVTENVEHDVDWFKHSIPLEVCFLIFQQRQLITN